MLAAEGPLQEWASQKGLPSDLQSLCKNEEAGKWMLDELNVTAKDSKLKVCCTFSCVSHQGFILLCWAGPGWAGPGWAGPGWAGLGWAGLGWAVLGCAVLCCIGLCWAVLCCAVLCCAVLCCAVLCCAALRCAVLCCAVLSWGCCSVSLDEGCRA